MAEPSMLTWTDYGRRVDRIAGGLSRRRAPMIGRSVSWSTEISALLTADADIIARRLLEHVAREAPEFGTRAELGVVRAHVEKFAWLLRPGVDAGEIEVPWVAIVHARRCAQEGVDIAELMRWYRLGHAWLFDQLAAHARDHHQSPSALAHAVAHAGALSFRYMDAVCARVASEYASKAGALSQNEIRKTRVIRELISGAPIDSLAAERTLGYRLDGRHVALLLWRAEADQPAPPDFSLQRTAEQIASAMKATARLWGTEDPELTVAWITVADDEVPGLEQVAALVEANRVVVAVSRPSRGATGFREARRQAERAREVAVISGEARAGGLIRYDDISLVSLLSDDLDAASAFVADELGDLARNDSTSELLRQTVLTFVRSGSARDTAAMLFVHRNTVAQRLRRADALIGRPLRGRRLEIEVALLLCERLGRKVIVD